MDVAAVMMFNIAALPVFLARTNRHHGCCQRNDEGEERETHYHDDGVLEKSRGDVDGRKMNDLLLYILTRITG
jgi:hypothetical protein